MSDPGRMKATIRALVGQPLPIMRRLGLPVSRRLLSSGHVAVRPADPRPADFGPRSQVADRSILVARPQGLAPQRNLTGLYG